MYIKKKKSWEISENETTCESLYLNRRKLLHSAGLAGVGLMIGGTSSFAAPIGGFPPARNPEYTLDRARLPLSKMQPPIQISMNLVPQKTSGGKQKNLAQTRGLSQ